MTQPWLDEVDDGSWLLPSAGSFLRQALSQERQELEARIEETRRRWPLGAITIESVSDSHLGRTVTARVNRDMGGLLCRYPLPVRWVLPADPTVIPTMTFPS